MRTLSGQKPDECLLDMDGVFVDFVGGVNAFLGINMDAMPRPIPFYWMLEPAGLTVEEFWAKIDFPEFWENLSWTPDGLAIINLMESHFEFENICILTNPSGMESAVIGKRRWLKKHLPKYFAADQFLIGSKKQFCAGAAHKLLVDDSDSNIQSFIEHRGVGLLVPRIWNSEHLHSDQSLDHLTYALG